MNELNASCWTKSAYDVSSQCDLQVNNMCEAFNKFILELRDKPIINLMEGIKVYLMQRIVSQMEKMLRYNGPICPKIQEIYEKIKREAGGWTPEWCGDDQYSLFEVSKNFEKFVVNINKRTCSCRKWDLNSIPCCHGVACLWQNNYNPEAYVAACYRYIV